MLPNFKDGEACTLYRYSKIERFDVVVYKDSVRYPEDPLAIKRVVGMPGDYFEYQGTNLYINGRLVKQPAHYMQSYTLHPTNLAPDTYFLMGDNRPDSMDSRRNGPVQRRDILGVIKR